MPSLDVVSTADLQALDNAINNVKREISTRFDFKNVKSEITLDRKGKCIHIVTADGMKIKTDIEILRSQCLRLNVDPSFWISRESPPPPGHNKGGHQDKGWYPRETCLEIVKLIKSLKVKVQPSILDDHIRISGNKIDDLQGIMRLLLEQDYDLNLQFVNIKR